MGLLSSLRRKAPGVRAPESRGWQDAEGAGVRGSGSLAEAHYVGLPASSGESIVNHYPKDVGVESVRAILPVDTPPEPDAGARVFGPPRPQRHVLAMAGPATEYRDAPFLNGHHAEVVGRPFVLGDIHIVWADQTGDTQYRQPPPTDAGNPAPRGC